MRLVSRAAALVVAAIVAVAVRAIGAGWREDPDTLPLLREHASTDEHQAVREAAP